MAGKKDEPVKKVREKQRPEYISAPVKTPSKQLPQSLDEMGGSIFTTEKISREFIEAKKEIGNLKKQNKSLLERVNTLESRVNAVEISFPVEKTVIFRAINREQAEKEICALFAKGKTLYYSDIAQHLNLDLQTVVEICHDLQKRGEIKIDDNALQSR